MKTIRLFIMLVFFSCVFGAIDALAGNVYGTSAVIYDYANNRTRGYSRTQVDYATAEYYTAYVCGELYKDGVYQVRACQSGIITATIYTQYTGTSATGSVVSDHYVDMKYFDEEQSSYIDYSGYRFLPGNNYPIDWFFYPAEIFGYFPVSIYLGSTYNQIPTKLRFIHTPPRAPNGIGPEITVTNGDVLDTAGNVKLSNQCGVYRNMAYELVDQQDKPIVVAFNITETFADYSGVDSVPGTLSQSISAGNIVGDTQYMGRTAPTCLGTNDNESFTQHFMVTLGGKNHNLTTVVSILRGRFSGTYMCDVAITTP
jgi:hypothetical protein